MIFFREVLPSAACGAPNLNLAKAYPHPCRSTDDRSIAESLLLTYVAVITKKEASTPLIWKYA